MPLRPLLLVAAAGAALIVPAVALAVPPENDNYLASTAINETGRNVPRTYANTVDTTEATTQTDMFNPNRDGQPFGGAGPENTVCKGTPFGKTVWYDFHPKYDGGVEVKTVGGFDSVVTVYEWSERTSQITRTVQCQDTAGVAEDMILTNNVKGGHAYTVQVGGVAGPGGLIAGGSMTFTLDYFRDTDGDGFYDDEGDKCRTLPGPRGSGGCPPALNPFASLNFDQVPGVGIKLTRLALTHIPKGAKVVALCGGCPKQAKSFRGGTIEFKKLYGRTVRAGSKVQLRVTMGRTRSGKYKYGATGALISWPIVGDGIGAKSQKCIKVGTKSKTTKCP
jgi:hypothetical protein